MCTRDEVLTFDDPVLFPSVPITYVITLEGSDRYDKLMHELMKYKPTKTVVIVHHKKRSICDRPSWVKKPSDDLWRNNLMIAKRDPTSPVLILEDDVHFLPRVLEYASHIDHVVATDQCEAYSLGTTAAVTFPSSTKDMTILFGGSAHAILYSKIGRQRLVREYYDDPAYKDKGLFEYLMPCWIHDLEVYYHFHMLTSLEPCAVQSHPKTENQKEWGSIVVDMLFMMTGAREDGTIFYEYCHALGRYFGGAIPFMIGFILIFWYGARQSRKGILNVLYM